MIPGIRLQKKKITKIMSVWRTAGDEQKWVRPQDKFTDVIAT
jgi:hypothetical protein